jgi:uncharacterized membrane protein YdcZ (DUF606 family)
MKIQWSVPELFLQRTSVWNTKSYLIGAILQLSLQIRQKQDVTQKLNVFSEGYIAWLDFIPGLLGDARPIA